MSELKKYIDEAMIGLNWFTQITTFEDIEKPDYVYERDPITKEPVATIRVPGKPGDIRLVGCELFMCTEVGKWVIQRS